MFSFLPKPFVPVAVAAAITCTTGLAAADYTHDVPVPIRDAPDELSGRFILAPKLAYLLPMGSAEEQFSQRGYIKSGAALGMDLAFGISRYAALRARFEYGTFGSGGDCPSGATCEATTMAVGAGVDYHLVNGAAFDPWMGVGLGYRIMKYELSSPGNQTELDYGGIDWLHLAVGGDWYPHSMIGFGPYMALDVGTYGSRPDEAAPGTSNASGSAIHSFVSIGLRGVFNPMR